MESPPPYHRRSKPSPQSKSASRLGRIVDGETTQLALDLTSPTKATSPTDYSNKPLPLREILLQSPSPVRRSRTRLAEKFDMAAEEAAELSGPRKKRKSKANQMTLLGCASPKNSRKSKKRSELEIREEKESGVAADENGKPKKRRQSSRSKKEKTVPSLSISPQINETDEGSLDRIGEMISDMVMWKDVAKSSLWFGFGCLGFFSSCFTKGINFSIFSAISKLGLLSLGVSFLSNSFRQRNIEDQKKLELKLNEDDMLRLAKFMLPATNLAISKMRELFSGEPSMTLKVIPYLLLGSEFGHLITIWRLCALGFFISFTVPKLYSSYACQINEKAENIQKRVIESWGGCSRKKILAASAVTAFWNLTSVKTRILAVFISLVIFRHRRQHLVSNSEEGDIEEVQEQEEEQTQEIVKKKEEQLALVVSGDGSQKP